MRTKKTIINFISDAFPQIIIMLLGIFKSKYFLQYLGNDTLGLYQLYGQIVSYLVLVEGGVGSAMLFRLYKPIHDKDEEKINEIMSASKIIFNIIGIAILVLGTIIAFNIKFFIKDYNFSDIYIFITFLMFLISQSINYFALPYRIMFDANQDRHIPNIVYQSITIVKSIIEIVIVCSGLGLIEILISLIICGLLSNILIYIFFKRKYKAVSFKTKRDFSMLKDIKHLFVNTIGNLVANNIDIVLVSKFVGLGSVVIYSTYNYFIEAIKQLVDKVTGATISGVGDVLVDNDNNNSEGIFNEFNKFMFYISIIICVPLFIFINPFINIFYAGKIQVSIIYSLLFAILLYLNIIRIPLKVFSLSSGKFAEVKRIVILEIIINLVLSLALINFWGIAGVLFATIISIVVSDFIFKAKIVCKKIVGSSVLKYYSLLIMNTVFCLCISLVSYFAVNYNYKNIFYCIISGIIFTIINFIITTIFFYITKQLDFIKRIKGLIIRR